jgi:hypothetical protein
MDACESPAAVHVALGGSALRFVVVELAVELAAGPLSKNTAAATNVPAAPSRATVVRIWGFIDPPGTD